MKHTLFFIFLLCNLCSHSEDKKTIKLAFTGDIMMGTTFPDSVRGIHLPPQDGKLLFKDVTPVLQQADATFGNLEGTLLDRGGEVKKYKNPNTFFAFRTPVKYVTRLVEAGYTAVSIANNHINDFGTEGRKSTLNTLTQSGIYYAGLQGKATKTFFTKEGIRYGFCAFGHSANTPNINDIEAAQELVRSMRDSCDLLIVSFHGGAEGASFKRVPFKTELFHEEKRGDVARFAHSCIDAGADVVYGHGPHVPRAIELYKNRIIAYSLGNFCTPYRMSLKNASGYAPVFVVEVNQKGEFVKGKIHSFIQQPTTGPRKDEKNLVAKEIRSLTLADFPKTEINIGEDGEIERQKALEPEFTVGLNNLINEYLGKPYSRGSDGPRAFDCSGFTSYIYKQLGYDLKRSSGQQFQEGTPVSKKEIQIGDLVFFGGRGSYRNIGHVGIVVDVDKENSTFRFAHACSRGVVIDDISEKAYYRQKYVGARRVVNN